MKTLFSFLAFCLIASVSLAVTNTWQGDVSNLWKTASNWSQGHVPLTTEDVSIPSGTPNDPDITVYDAGCNNLTIALGVSLGIFGKEIHVYGNASISGSFYFDDALSFLLVDGNISWNAGSSVDTWGTGNPGQTQIKVKGDWTFMTSSQVNLEPLRVELNGTSPSVIKCYSSTSSFYRLEICKVGSYAIFSSLSTVDMKIDRNLFIDTDAELQSVSSLKIVVGTTFLNFGHIHLSAGTLEFAAVQYTNDFNAGDYVNHLTLAGSSTAAATMNGNLTINGNLNITSTFYVNFYDHCLLKGNLTNNNPLVQFDYLEFQGTSNQNCIMAYCDTIRLNKSGGYLAFPSDSTYCDVYNWLQGTLNVNGGKFWVADLADPGIYGSIIVTSGTLTYHQNVSQYIDLQGDIFMNGGVFKVYGGSGNSYWPYTHNGSIAMYGGTLDFVDVGIDIRPPSSYTFTSVISGGTIATSGDFIVQRTDFNPTGGYVVLKGDDNTGSSDPCALSVASGSNLYNLYINKEDDLDNITASGSLDINGYFIHTTGNFIAPASMYIAGDIEIYSPFVAGTGQVHIDGTADQDMEYCWADFNILNLNKSANTLHVLNSDVTCASYNWTQGYMTIENATIEVFDLMDDGIYGSYTLTGEDAHLYLHQDVGSGSYIDLNGFITINGGDVKVYGGADESYWSLSGNAGLSMTSGTLDFVDNGIRIYNSGTYTFTENVTGGTIRTAYDFRSYRTTWTPTGGTLELYGTSDATLYTIAGSNLFHLTIDKSAKAFVPDQTETTVTVNKGGIQKTLVYKKPDFIPSGTPWLFKRDKDSVEGGKSNSVMATTNLDLNGDFVLTSGTFTAPAQMNVAGNWANSVGSTAFTEGTGMVIFDGSASRFLITDETFYNVNINKSDATTCMFAIGSGMHLTASNDLHIVDGYLEMDYNSTLTTGGDITIDLNAGLNAYDDLGLEIYCEGDWLNSNTTFSSTVGFYPGTSLVVFNGTIDQNLTVNCATGDFYNLTVNKSTGKINPLTSSLRILNNFYLDNGTVVAPSAITTGGNWIDDGGTAVFQEGTGIVTFNGTGSQTCSPETFYRLELNKSAGSLSFPSGTTTCTYYNWTAGALLVNGGNFYVGDLDDNGIYGTITLSSGSIEIHQGTTGTEYVDLNGNLTITDGTMTVYGGSSTSYWPYFANATFTMNNGILDFVNRGIRIMENPTYTFSENITGGTIRTAYSFEANRSDYNPTGGTIELYGTTNTTVGHFAGSNFFNVEIDKSAKNNQPDYGEVSLADSREETKDEGAKANTVISGTDLDLNGNMLISSGTFAAPATLNVAGNWTNTVGDAGFTEGTGIVIFDGNMDADITNSETFYSITENKTQTGEQAMEIEASCVLGVLNDLHIQDGSFEMNNNSTLDITNDLNIDLNAGLNCFNHTGLNIYIGGDWTNLNVDYTLDRGFNSGTSTVTFDGLTQNQAVITTCVVTDFYNLVINKSGSVGTYSMEPADDFKVKGNVTVQNGNWHNSISGLSHEFMGNITISPAGMWHDSNGTISFTSGWDQYFNNQGFNNAYFNNVRIYKSNDKALILNSDMETNAGGNLIVDVGQFYFGGHTGKFLGDISINNGGKMTLSPGSVLKMENEYSLNVNSGGTFEMLGASGSMATVTHNNTGYYDFSVNSGGTISAQYGIFEFMNDDGIDINSGGIVNPSIAFNNCEFRQGMAGGPLLTIDNAQTIEVNGAVFPQNTCGSSFNVAKYLNTGTVNFSDYSGDFSGESFDYDPNNRINWEVLGFDLNLKVYLEGPYNGTNMNTSLSGLPDFPLLQPYNTAPWNYSGTENVGSIPTNVVDWILVELRDAVDAASATSATRIARQAGFLKNDGTIVGIDSVSNLQFTNSISHQLFVVIWYKNHLGIISSSGLTNTGGIYSWDFTTSSTQAYGGTSAQKSLSGGKWGMFSGDGDANDVIGTIDESIIWTPVAGNRGYLNADFSRDGQVNNKDKNDLWLPNIGKQCQVPD
jgi:hypothetical protein